MEEPTSSPVKLQEITYYSKKPWQQENNHFPTKVAETPPSKHV